MGYWDLVGILAGVLSGLCYALYSFLGRLASIRFSKLEAICKVLDCQAGDILE